MDFKLVLTPPKRRRTETDSKQRTNPIEEKEGKRKCLTLLNAKKQQHYHI